VKPLNPGNLKTELQRHVPSLQMRIFHWMSYAPIYGAYTELFAGLSPEVTMEKNGAWSRFTRFRKFDRVVKCG
jgi:retinol dehydrogenase-12